MTSPTEILHIDFETESKCDLKKAGVYAYAEHPSTKVHCLGYRFGKEEIQIWKPPEPFPTRIIEHVRSGGRVIGHNSSFELAIWNLVLRKLHATESIPALRISQTSCTMAQSLAAGLPGALDKLGVFLELAARKDMQGKKVMMRLMKPPKNGGEHPQDLLKILYDYCATDVKVESEIDDVTPGLSDFERRIWELDQIINNRGVRIDVVSATKAMEVVEAEKTHIKGLISILTEGLINSPSKNKKLLAWCQERDDRILDLKKDSLRLYLALDDLPDEVRTAIEYRQRFAKTSCAKIARMLGCLSKGERVRGLFQYHGAGTGRWAGRLFQIQNLYKPPYKEEEAHRVVEGVFKLLNSDKGAEEIRGKIETDFGDVLTAVASCTRGLIIADIGKVLAVVDWSNIEGRVAAWLAGEEWKVEAFRAFDRKEGSDLYRLAYANTFGIPIEEVDDKKRQVGKTMELAFQYAGTVGAWRKFDSKLPFYTDLVVKGIATKWRLAHKKIARLWSTLKLAAVSACQHPGKVYNGGTASVPILYKLIEEGYLIAKLPSGRCIFYPKASLIDTEYGPEVVYMAAKGKSGKIKEVRLWSGQLCENVVQAISADILRFAMLNLEEKGYKINFTVHDEIGCNIDKSKGQSLKGMEEIMCINPDWGMGIPLADAGWEGNRYRK